MMKINYDLLMVIDSLLKQNAGLAELVKGAGLKFLSRLCSQVQILHPALRNFSIVWLMRSAHNQVTIGSNPISSTIHGRS